MNIVNIIFILIMVKPMYDAFGDPSGAPDDHHGPGSAPKSFCTGEWCAIPRSDGASAFGDHGSAGLSYQPSLLDYYEMNLLLHSGYNKNFLVPYGKFEIGTESVVKRSTIVDDDVDVQPLDQIQSSQCSCAPKFDFVDLGIGNYPRYFVTEVCLETKCWFGGACQDKYFNVHMKVTVIRRRSPGESDPDDSRVQKLPYALRDTWVAYFYQLGVGCDCLLC